jgi:hypothetical protein
MVRLLIALALLLCCRATAAATFRLPGSPYPAPSQGANCSSTLLGYSSALQPSQLLLMTTLDGLAARTCPRFFRVGDESPGDMQTAFARDFPSFGSSVDASIAHDFPSLLAASTAIAHGYALCDMRQPATCAAATSFCAASQALAVVMDVHEEALAAALLKIPCVFDARNSSVSDVIKAFPLQRGASWSCSVAVLQHPAKLPFLSDLAVFARAVTARAACASRHT